MLTVIKSKTTKLLFERCVHCYFHGIQFLSHFSIQTIHLLSLIGTFNVNQKFPLKVPTKSSHQKIHSSRLLSKLLRFDDGFDI